MTNPYEKPPTLREGIVAFAANAAIFCGQAAAVIGIVHWIKSHEKKQERQR